MITVLWEDSRGVQTKGFGPHELLLSCLADELGLSRYDLGKMVESHPKNGNSNLRKSLLRDVRRLNAAGPVFAVVDRDKIHELWKDAPSPPHNCMSGIARQFRGDAPGDYDLIFLVQNVESLLDAVCDARGEQRPEGKPKPNERDAICSRAAWGTPAQRLEVRKTCPSFERIVLRVAEKLRGTAPDGGRDSMPH